MATNENLIPIPGRLHSVASEGHVAGADEIFDDSLNKDQTTINSELIQAVGTGGSVDSRIAEAVNVEKTRAEGAEEALDDRVDTLEEAVGSGGSVDERIEEAVAPKANSADVYAKTETYNKTELNNMITTPNQEYVSVTATAQTTAVTDVLPATGAADTTYRIGNWDGTQYNDSVFSEYAWNGSAYIKLSTKSQIGEVYDISANHADTKYADLAAALGTNGANIPPSLRKGGMSIKYVQSSDNKYVQYRLMSDFFNTTPANWQGVDDEPTAGSDNLVKSGGVEKNILIGSIIGNNTTYNSINKILSQNTSYVLRFFDNDWSKPSMQSGSIFDVKAKIGNTETILIKYSFPDDLPVPSEIYFKTPAEFDYIIFGGRASVNEKIRFVISACNDEQNKYPILVTSSLVSGAILTNGTIQKGRKDAHTVSRFKVTPNRMYKLHFLGKRYKVGLVFYGVDGSQVLNVWFDDIDNFITPTNCSTMDIQFRDTINITASNFEGVSIDTDEVVTPVNVANKLSLYNSLVIGQYSDPNNGTPTFFNNPYRLTTGLIPLRGKVSVSVNSGYGYTVRNYNSYNKIYDSGWQTDASVWELKGVLSVITIRKTDESALSNSDIANCGLTITALGGLFETLAGYRQLAQAEQEVDAINNRLPSRNLASILSYYIGLRFGLYSNPTNHIPVLQPSSTRMTTKLIPVQGTFTVSVASGYKLSVRQFDDYSVISDSGWQTGEYIFKANNSFWSITVANSEGTLLSESDLTDCSLVVANSGNDANYRMSSTLGSVLANERIDDIAYEKRLSCLFQYCHYFISKISNDSRIVIPCQSVSDIYVTKQLGGRVIELNVLFTSDGVPICRHAVVGTTLSGLIDQQGNDATVDVTTVTFDYLRSNYRYKSTLPQFETPITSLEEALEACSKYNIIPMITYNSSLFDMVSKHCGNNWLCYMGGNMNNLSRPSDFDINVPCVTWAYDTPTLEGMLNLIGRFGKYNSIGFSIDFLDTLTDTEVRQIVEKLNKYNDIGILDDNTDNVEAIAKYENYGFKRYYSVSIPNDFAFDETVVFNSLNNYNNLQGDFTIGLNKIVIAENDSVSFDNSLQSILSVGRVSIWFTGKIKITFGEYYKEVIVERSNAEFVLSTIFENYSSEFSITAVDGDVEIYNIGFDFKTII